MLHKNSAEASPKYWSTLSFPLRIIHIKPNVPKKSATLARSVSASTKVSLRLVSSHGYPLHELLFSLATCRYTLNGLPQSHVHTHQTTLTGYVHLIYTGVALAVFLLFYLFSPSLSVAVAAGTSVLL